MGRCKIWFAVVATFVIVSALGAVALPAKAEAATTKSKLRTAKVILRQSKVRLKTAQAALAAAAGTLGAATTDPTPSATPTPAPSPAADPAPAVEELQAKVVKARRLVRIWKKRVAKLAKRYRLERNLVRWEKQRKWRKIIEVAAAKYHVKAGGMYRMMMRESGGRQYAGSSTSFKGLFQYWTGTWAASWNPWRHDSIYDGSSQIFATAYAIHKGMGPQMWTTTFASQY